MAPPRALKVRFTPRAHGDLEAIVQYLTERNPRSARDFKLTLEATIEIVGNFPNAGRLAGENAVRALPVGRYPYLIYWTVEANEAWVVHIRDGRRKPWRPRRGD